MARLQRVVAAVVSAPRAIARVAVRAMSSTSRPEVIPTANIHRSNAQELVSQVPVIEVEGHVAMCDGGGGATGHPIEYIQLDKRAGAAPATCKYCGLRYKMSHHH